MVGPPLSVLWDGRGGGLETRLACSDSLGMGQRKQTAHDYPRCQQSGWGRKFPPFVALHRGAAARGANSLGWGPLGRPGYGSTCAGLVGEDTGFPRLYFDSEWPSGTQTALDQWLKVGEEIEECADL